MVLIQLLLMLMIWFSRSATHGADGPIHSFSKPVGLAIFLGVYFELILGLRIWSVRLAKRIGGRGLGRSLQRFNRVIDIAKFFVPVWLAVGIYGGLQWGVLVDGWMAFLNRWPFQEIQFPQLVVGIAPAMLAWIGLWWADYPAERAMREHTMAYELDQGLAVHAPPTFGTVFKNNFRLQVLFMTGPILTVLLARDIAVTVLSLVHARHQGLWETICVIVFVKLVYIFAPEILRRAVPTERLPDSPLRRRLENLCKRSHIRYREILVWKTSNSMGNAMVMGLFPRVRYILMSDLLLERMSDDQIEAVFAHEMGHVVHRHLWWYVAYMILFFGVAAGPLTWAINVLSNHLPMAWQQMEGADSISSLVQASLLLLVFILPFMQFSQRLERQADVFAARVIQMNQPATNSSALLPPRFSHTYVGEYGAGLFASALREVAVINRMPLTGRNWLHGSIQSRMNYLYNLSGDPARTTNFDRKMGRLFAAVLVTLCTFGVWGAVQSLQSARGAEPVREQGSVQEQEQEQSVVIPVAARVGER